MTLGLLLGLTIAAAQLDSTSARPISQWVHTRWSTREGAPSEIYSLAQTVDGYLWIGGSTGLIRFDGVRFATPTWHDPIPYRSGVRSLLATRDGSLWILWGNGQTTWVRDGHLRTYGETEGLPKAFALAGSKSGIVVAATLRGVRRFNGDRWDDPVDWQYPGRKAHQLWFDRDDALWVTTEDRVVYRPADAPRFVDPGIRLSGDGVPAGFGQDKHGTVWLTELYRSVHTLARAGEDTTFTEVRVGSWSLLFDRGGSLWIGSAGDGLRRVADPARIRGKSVAQFGTEAEQFTERDGLLSNIVTAMLEDREGSIWVATTRGLERFRAGPFTQVPTAGSVRPRVLYAARDSAVWVMTYGSPTLLRIGPAGRDSIPTGHFFALSVAQKRDGSMWTVDGKRILQLQRGRFVPIALHELERNRLAGVAIDLNDSVLVHDEGRGVLRLRGDRLETLVPTGDSAFTYGTVRSDSRGRIWYGTHYGATLYDGGKSRKLAPTFGLVRDFYEDRNGAIWLSSYGGWSKFVNDELLVPTASQELPGRAVFGLVEDDSGALWLATRRGVLRMPPGELDRALADSTHTPRYQTLDGLDGLPGAFTGSLLGSVITRATNGRIWVATDSGVVSFAPEAIRPPDPPPAIIEAVRIGDRLVPASGEVRIPPRTRELEIEYTAMTLAVPERVHFRYRLEGEDKAWSDVGTRRRAYYTGLAPGRYTFQVSASHGDGRWNEAASLMLRILPAWYQTLWFRSVVVLTLGGLVAAATALVQRRRHGVAQRALKVHYEATLAERARIAQDLHDTLLQGFAGVALQLKTIELALPEQPDIAAETVVRVQRLTRDSLREARERVWEMHGTDLGEDDLATALESIAREHATAAGIDVNVDVRGERRRLSRAQEDTAFRVGREAIVNAVRHAGARRLELAVDFGPATLKLEVRDNGRGFTPDQADDARRKGHFGLSGIRERALHAGGSCEIRARPGGGTVVSLQLPLR